MLTSYDPWLLFWVPSIAFAGATLLTVVSLRVGAWVAGRRVTSQPPARPTPPQAAKVTLFDEIAAALAADVDREWAELSAAVEGGGDRG